MANIKFSQFTVETAKADVDFLVGYSGPDNVQISPTNLLSDYSQGTGAAGQVTFFSATSTVTGDNNLYWNNTNKRLGIGTTSPLAPLTVTTPMSSSRTSILYLDVDGTNTNGGGGEIVFNTSATVGNLTNFNAKITGTRVFGAGGDSELGFWTTLVADNQAAQQRMVITKEGNVGIGTNSPVARLQAEGSFISSGISQLGSAGANVYLTSSSAGNVGIGTSSPSQKLDVNGSVNADSYKISNTTVLSGSADVYVGSGGGTGRVFLNNTSGIGLALSGANIGIGTTSPTTKLHIDESGTTSPALFIDTARYGASIIGDGTSNSQYLLNLQSNGGSTEVMRVQSSGNVGIGTTSPNALLHLESASSPALQITDTTQPTTLRLYAQDSNTHVANITAHDMVFDTNNTERMRITSTGNVGIGTTSPSNKLDVNGNIAATSSGNTALSVISTGGYSQLITQASDSDSAYIFFKDTSGERARLYSSTSNDLIFKTGGGGTTALTLSNSGDVTVGDDLNITGNELTFTNDAASAYIRAADSLLIQSDWNTGENKPIYLQPSAVTELTIATGSSTFAGRVVLGNVGSDKKIQFNRTGGNTFSIEHDSSQIYFYNETTSTVAFKISNASNATFAGDIEVDDSASGLILKSPDGTRYRVTVANGGTLSVSAV